MPPSRKLFSKIQGAPRLWPIPLLDGYWFTGRRGKGKEVTEGDSCVENEKMASTRFRQFVAVCPPNEAQPPKLVRLRSFSFCKSNPLSRAGGLVLSKGGCNLQRERTPLPYPLTHSPHCPLTFPTTPDILTNRPPTFIKVSRTS